MCEYIKTKFPHIYLYTSTNGLALNEEKARRLVHSGIDEVTFSIDGASQDTYVRYRQRGKFDLAVANLHAMADEKARHGRDVPQINWRYILFNWNDSDEEMEQGPAARRRARRRSAVVGDHRSPRGLVLAPLRARHRRLRPHQVPGLGSLRPGQRHPGRDAAGRHRRAGRSRRCRCSAGAPASRSPSDPGAQPARRGRSATGQLRPPPGAARRAAGRRRRRAPQPRPRAGLAAGRHPGRRRRRRDHRRAAARDAGPLRAQVRPGPRRHRLVRECGSPTTTRSVSCSRPLAAISSRRATVDGEHDLPRVQRPVLGVVGAHPRARGRPLGKSSPKKMTNAVPRRPRRGGWWRLTLPTCARPPARGRLTTRFGHAEVR